MKKRIFLLAFILCLIGINHVDAKIVSKDDIPAKTYVIGNYMYTRDVNTTYNYNGELTTQEIMLASKTIDGNIDDMIIYYKKINGAWINGLTGESIEVPQYFEIKNRNLRDILPTPDLNCETGNNGGNGTVTYKHIDCVAAIVVDSNFITTRSESTSTQKVTAFDGGVEYYYIKKTDGSFPDEQAFFDETTGQFYGKNSHTKLVAEYVTNTGGYEFPVGSNEPFYQLSSRFYYLDGDEKIYSEYSDVDSNGASAKFGIGLNDLYLDSTVNENYNVRVNSSVGKSGVGINGEVNYYNVTFNITDVHGNNVSTNYDRSKYKIIDYKVYSWYKASDGYSYTHDYEVNNAEGGSDTLKYLYIESLYDKKYTTEFRPAGNSGTAYMIAEVNGYDVFGEYQDVIDVPAISKRLYWAGDENSELSRTVTARVTVCNLAETECYKARAIYSPKTDTGARVLP